MSTSFAEPLGLEAVSIDELLKAQPRRQRALLLDDCDVFRVLALVGCYRQVEQELIVLAAVAPLGWIRHLLGRPRHVEESEAGTFAVYDGSRLAIEAGLRLADSNLRCGIDRLTVTWNRLFIPVHVCRRLLAIALANDAERSCFMPSRVLDDVSETGKYPGYRIGFSSLRYSGDDGRETLERVDLWAIASQAGLRPVGLVRQLRFSAVAAYVANAVTTFRLFCTMATAISLYRGSLLFSLFWYTLGLMSDTFDGFVARQFNGTTAWGKAYDAYVDMFHNSVSVVALCIYAYARHRYVAAGVVLAGTFLPVAVGRRWIEPDSAAAKIRSGLTRVVIIAVMLPLVLREVGGTTAILALSLLGVVSAYAVSHELGVIRDEVANHACGYWKRPLYVPPRRDTALISAIGHKLKRLWRKP